MESNHDDSEEKLPIAAVKMARATQAANTTRAQDLAQALIHQEGDVEVARARLQAFQRLIAEAERYLARD